VAEEKRWEPRNSDHGIEGLKDCLAFVEKTSESLELEVEDQVTVKTFSALIQKLG